jgi:hypothetical protein
MLNICHRPRGERLREREREGQTWTDKDIQGERRREKRAPNKY